MLCKMRGGPFPGNYTAPRRAQINVCLRSPGVVEGDVSDGSTGVGERHGRPAVPTPPVEALWSSECPCRRVVLVRTVGRAAGVPSRRLARS